MVHRRGARVLIVDDDWATARIQQHRLERDGWQAEIATSVEAAARIAREKRCDLMLLDYRLPGGVNGFQFYDQLKSSGNDIPTVLVTGYGSQEVIVEALRAGVRDFVAKTPGYLDELSATASKVLKQRQLEDRLLHAETRLASVFHSSPVGIALARRTDGMLIEVNESFCALVGYRRPEDFAHDDAALPLWPCAETQQAFLERVARDEHISDEEFAVCTRSGETRIARITVELVSLDGEECILTFASDITEQVRTTAESRTARQQAERALRESQQRFQAFMDNSPTIAFMKDDEGRYIFVNRFMTDHFRRTAESMLGKNDVEIHPAASAHQFRQNDRAVMELGRPLTLVEAVAEPDGTQSQWIVQKFPFLDETGRKYLGGVGVNITERLQAEEALRRAEEQFRQSQKMEAIGRLAGGIAHDFNNLLTVILGNAEYATVEIPTDHPLQECLSEILDAGRRAATLTTQLLAFSRRQMLEPQSLNLSDLVADMHKLLSRLIGADVCLETTLPADLAPIRADRGQLERILMNLAINARDAMPRGGRLSIETSNCVLAERDAAALGGIAAGHYVRLSVRDTGCGMTSEIKARAFEPFFTTKPTGKGTGMGLPTVFGIAQQSGGTVAIDSEPEQGTAVILYLPRAESVPIPASLEPPLSDRPRGTETVLLVEDEPPVRMLGGRILKEAGYVVLEAGSGIEALTASASFDRSIDLLVTDVVMPAMSGRQLAAQIQQQRPGIRVLYVSGYTDDAIVHHRVLEPGTEFLQKPYTPDSLARSVRGVLDRECRDRPG